MRFSVTIFMELSFGIIMVLSNCGIFRCDLCGLSVEIIGELLADEFFLVLSVVYHVLRLSLGILRFVYGTLWGYEFQL